MEFLVQIAGFFTALITGLAAFVNPAIAYVAEPFSLPKHEGRIIFVGDMMFDRTIRTTMQEYGGAHLFSCIDYVLREADLVVGNLEGPISDFPSRSVGSKPRDENNFTFTFPTSTAMLLYEHNIRLVNLGNNHIANFGREGMVQTKNWLTAAGVQYFGLPAEASAQAGDPQSAEAERVAQVEINGIAFSFVNWSEWTPVGKPSASNLPAEASAQAGGAGELNPVVEQIKKEAKAGRVVVVYTHWGEQYVPTPEHVKVLARQFVDAGAEIVIGSHPHIIQEHELYEGKHIYYSLGNFIFDQYWNEEVRTGLLLDVVFDDKGIRSVEEKETWLQRDRSTCLKSERKAE